jgi:hypothetical protein
MGLVTMVPSMPSVANGARIAVLAAALLAIPG